MAALAACYPLAAHSAAGMLQFVIGDVSIRRGGTTIAAAKGGNVESGDSLATGPTGRAQIKFSDGGFIALQPNTKFEVTRYADTGDTRQDKFLVKLAEGGLRAITGAIGHRNHDNYTVETPTALIGIRGSSFTAFYDPNDRTLRVANEQDSIQVCTSGGCVGLTAGETALVSPNSTNQQPARTNYRPTLPVPVPVQAPQVVSNQSTPAGTPEVVVQAVFAPQSEQPPGVQVAAGTHPGETVPVPAPPAPVPTPPAPTPPAPVPTPPAPVPTPPAPVPTPPAPVPVPPVPVPPPPAPAPAPSSPNPPPPSPAAPAPTSVSFSANSSAFSAVTAGVVEFDTNGDPQKLGNASTIASSTRVLNRTSVTGNSFANTGDINTSDYLVVGTWGGYSTTFGAPPGTTVAGTGSLGFVAGQLAPSLPTPAAPAQHATYTLVGASPVYSSSYSPIVNGISNASMAVDFSSASANLQMAFDAAQHGDTYHMNGSVTANGVSFSGTIASVGVQCVAGLNTCQPATIDGFFTGPSASGIGLKYSTSSTLDGTVQGTLGFSRASTGSIPMVDAFATSPAPSFLPVTYLSAGGNGSGSLLLDGDQHLQGSQLQSARDGTSTYSIGAVPGTTTTFGSIGTSNTVNFVGWGYWSSVDVVGAGNPPPPATTYADAHYVTVQAPPPAAMPVSGFATYTMVGGTAPTLTHGGPAVSPGSLNSASLTVDFIGARAQASVGYSVGTYANQTLAKNDLSLSGNRFSSGSTSPDNISGFIGGDNAQYAGFTFTRVTSGDTITGAVGLQATQMTTPARGSLAAAPNGTTASFAVGNGASFFGNNSSGGPMLIAATPLPVLSFDSAASGKLLEVNTSNFGGSGNGVSYPGTYSVPNYTASASKSGGNVGSTDFVGWGYWSDATNIYGGTTSEMKALHYVVGTPTANISTASGTATYALTNSGSASTTPTLTDSSGNTTTATLQSAVVTANFVAAPTPSTLTADITVTGVNGSTARVYASGLQITGANSTFFSTAPTVGAPATTPPPAGTTSISGLFVGALPGSPAPNVPGTVALTYRQSNPTASAIGSTLAGALVLKK